MTSKESKGVALLRKPRPPKRTMKLQLERGPSTEYLGCEDETLIPSRQKQRWNTAEASWNDTNRSGRKQFEVHPLHPKGPPFLRPMLRSNLAPPIPHILTQTLPDEILFLSAKEISKKDKFILNSFLIPTKLQPPPKIKSGCVSRQNYQKLTSWFTCNVPSQEEVNSTVLELDVLAPPTRVPKLQVLVGKVYA